MLRSIRLFGGKLNQSDILACVPLKKGEIYDDSLGIINQLVNLNISYTFIKDINWPYPRTLLKFEAFKSFDFTKYNHLLWLDADIIIANDPISILKFYHSDWNTISCVPELYNYMIRYPHVNETDLVWNPSLPAFNLLGDNTITSSGVCNTGVLLMDRDSLKTILLSYEEIFSQIESINPYKYDRFLDSLILVSIIAKKSIQISPLPYELN